MDKNTGNKYFKWGLCVVLSGATLMLLYAAMNNVDTVKSIARSAFMILSPFVYGLIMAYLLCPVYNGTVKLIKGICGKKYRDSTSLKLAKTVGSFASLIVLLGIIIGLFSLILPETLRSITGLVKSLPEKADALITWANSVFLDSNPEYTSVIEAVITQINTTFTEWTEAELLPQISTYISDVVSGVMITAKTLLNIIIGIFVCIYFLNSKDVFKVQSRKAIYALFNKERAHSIFDFFNFTDVQFGSFIKGKLFDSLIIGILCALFMTIFNMPYVVLISTIVGITNFIPFFGPFIGAVPGILIILLENPVQAVGFGILILLLQMFDGTVLGPKILGKTSGLASIWVLFAILLFGGLFSFVGMIIAVPTFAVIYFYTKRYINKRLKDKNMPTDTAAYESRVVVTLTDDNAE